MKIIATIICLATAAMLGGCSVAKGIGSLSASAGYTSPTTGIVYGVNYTKKFEDGKAVLPPLPVK